MTPTKPKLLIVDDDEEIRTQMRWALTRDYDIVLAEDRVSALKIFQAERPMVVLLDLGLPPSPGTPEEGLKTLAELLEVERLTKVVVITGQGEKQVALQAIGAGAYHFQCKPVEMDELKILLARCFYIAELEREYHALQQGLGTTAFESIIGANARMQNVFSAIKKVAQSNAPVLILGESGTGKEMVARAIHNRSARKDGPFVAINCSAIPEALMESELFGHEKGSFTGAHALRKGRFESAEGGTLFLDELGEIPLLLQVKLLRFLQESRIERVGGRQEIAVDTRVIAATHVDLTQAMTAGTFREDLFYRLAVVQINLPPLREREDDVILLAQSCLKKFAAESGSSGFTFTPKAIDALKRHTWPGNVRELQNRVRRATIMSSGKRITPEDLELSSGAATQNGVTLKEARETVEREMIQQALRKHGGKISAAAIELDVSRPTFYELMDKLGIKRPE
ncbi:MAG: PEP-CTERM-box response regulator transcription factor [Verrucomicrobia bacterium]|nr:PEP-CTERM-box response regulator transcription factor [Verrucomicrobiota bacterium]